MDRAYIFSSSKAKSKSIISAQLMMLVVLQFETRSVHGVSNSDPMTAMNVNVNWPSSILWYVLLLLAKEVMGRSSFQSCVSVILSTEGVPVQEPGPPVQALLPPRRLAFNWNAFLFLDLFTVYVALRLYWPTQIYYPSMSVRWSQSIC